MRILHVVTTAQRRGAEMFTYDLTRALAPSGVEQRIAVLRNGTVDLRYEPEPSYLGANGSNIPGLRMDIRAVGSLRQIVKAWRPDVIQAYGGEPLKYAVTASIGTSNAIVYRKIGAADGRVRRGPRRAIHARFIRRADRVVAVAESIGREAIDVFHIAPQRVVTIPRGIDPGRLRPARPRATARRSLELKSSQFVMLSLGAFTWEKDPVAQVRIAARVLEASPDAVFLMAGAGPLRPDVEAAIARTAVGERIRLLGSRPDVADLLAASDVLLLASVSEGMPGVVIEAGMAGRPVAGYAIAGVPEVVLDGETGLLARPGDEETLTRNVLSLAENAALRARLGRRAKTRCLAHYDISTIASRYLALYHELA